MTSLFEFASYKSYLRQLIQANREKRGFQALLARAAGCQPSYLSQVLTGKAELLPDHAAGLAKHLEMNDLECDFFLTLVLHGRATSRTLKSVLEKKLSQLRASQSQLAARIPDAVRASAEAERFYYSSWYWAAIHVGTSVPELQSVGALAGRLSLPQARVRGCLEELERHGMVRCEGGKWIYAGGAAHLPRESIMTEMNHAHWRQRSLVDVQNGNEDSIHYTSVFTLSAKDVDRVREFLIQSIAQSRKITDPSEPEEIYSLNIDFFRV